MDEGSENDMLTVNEIVVGYKAPVAGPLTFSYPDGQCVMLTGRNGSGKTTLMKTLAGLLSPVSGAFESDGEVLMVPTRIPKVKGFSVREFIRTSMLQKSGVFSKLDPRAEHSLEEVIRLMNLEGLADKDLSRISDGEFQKACIATAMTRRANVILLDEPTAFLDVENRVMVLGALQSVAHSTGTTIIFSTHDIYDGERYSDDRLEIVSSPEISLPKM